MIVFVLGSMMTGLVTGGYAYFSGTSLIFAIMLYSSIGILTMAMVLLRAFICQQITEAKKTITSHDASGPHVA